MRHQYTPVFRELTTSSMWAQDSDTRIVWIWMLLHADPEGYVAAAIPGVALAAHVTVEAAKRAVELLESPDPYSRSKEHEGRRLESVPGGWRILNFVPYRERAKQEAAKARKRAWAKREYDDRQLTLPHVDMDYPGCVEEALGDVQTPSDSGQNRENLDAPKPKPKSKYSSAAAQLQNGPQPPQRASNHEFGVTLPAVVHTLDGWEPSDELRSEAQVQGIVDFDQRVAALRLSTIGGKSGVRVGKVDDYIRTLLPKWRAWRETDAHKDALSRAAKGAPKRFGGGEPPLEPTERERGHARKHGYDIDELFRALNEQDCVTRLGREGARDEAKRRMAAAAKAAKERAA